jgi:hypothetical protein
VVADSIFVAWLISFTDAPGTAAPFGSVTVPLTFAFACAKTIEAPARITAKNAIVRFRKNMTRPSQIIFLATDDTD